MATQTDWQNLILLEVGAALDAPTRPELDAISPNIALIFSIYADKAYYPRLQYLFAKRHCLDILRGRLRMLINGSMGGISQSFNQVFTNLNTLYNDTNAEIARTLKEASANRVGGATTAGAVVPAGETTAAQVPPGITPGQVFDPNAPAYRGDVTTNANFPGGRYGV